MQYFGGIMTTKQDWIRFIEIDHKISKEVGKKHRLRVDDSYLYIPYFSPSGEEIFTKKRQEPTYKRDNKYLYPRGSFVTLYPYSNLSDHKEWILTEGELDALTLESHDIPAITTGSVTSFNQKFVNYFKDKKVSICFDTDKAGRDGAEKVAQVLVKAGVDVDIVDLPEMEGGKDIGDYFRLGHTKEEFEELVNNARRPNFLDDSGVDSDPEKKKTKVQELVELALNADCRVYLNMERDPVIVFPHKPLIAYSIKSNEFRGWLSGAYYAISEEGFSDETFLAVVHTLEARAYHEEEVVRLYNRIAKVDDVIYYDLGNGKTVVRIDSNDWAITTDCPIKFKRFKHQLQQIEPKKGGEISRVLQFVNIFDPNEQLLFITYLIAVFIPDIPRTVLVHIGDQGAAKSTAMRLARSLIDPSIAELLIPPSDIPELALAANHNYCLYLDNMSYLSDQLSDVLCRLVTGVGFTKRKLFTDAEDIILNQIVAIGITGISNVATKPDLLDRCLILRFHRISDEKREDEGEFWQKFNKEKPYILGAIFTALSKVLQIVPTLRLKQKPRMADYGKYASAAAIALGSSADIFLSAFAENVKRQNDAAIEASAVAQVVIEFMNDKENWEGSSSELYGLLRTFAINANLEIGGKNGFPKASNWLWKKIHVIKPNLTAMGIHVLHTESSTGSIIKLSTSSHIRESTASTATQLEIISSGQENIATKNADTAIDTSTHSLLKIESESDNLPNPDGNMATMAVEKVIDEIPLKE